MALPELISRLRRWFTDTGPAAPQPPAGPDAPHRAPLDPEAMHWPEAGLDDAAADLPEADAEQAWWRWGGEEPDNPPESAQIDTALYQKLCRAIDDPNLELPQARQVARQALVMLRDQVDYPRLARVIGSDPVLTAEILKVTNSVAFGGVDKITRLDQAFARLGERELRRILLATGLKSIAIQMGVEGPCLSRGLLHAAIASGAFMSHIAGRWGLSPDEAFVMGLLHNLGKFGILKVCHDFQRQTDRAVTRATFDRLCDDWHEHIGLRLAGAWDLPDPLPALIGRHHHSPADDDPLRTEVLLLQLTEITCSILGYAPRHHYEFFELPCVQRLGLADDERTAHLLEPVPDLLEQATRTYI